MSTALAPSALRRVMLCLFVLLGGVTSLSAFPKNRSQMRRLTSRRIDFCSRSGDGYSQCDSKRRSSTALCLGARGGGDSSKTTALLSSNDTEQEESSNRGRLILIGVAFLYGTLNVALRQLYATPGPPAASALSATRGWLAAACFLPLAPQIRRETKESNSGTSGLLLLAALELAVWNFGAQGLVNVGLLFTESARASFLTQTSVVITPLISVLAGQKISSNIWIGCGSALAGLALLSGGGGGGALSLLTSFSTGDLLILGGAVCWSMYIFRISSIGSRFPETSLQATKTTILATLYTCWFAWSAWSCYSSGTPVQTLWIGWKNLASWAILIFSAIGPGALGDVLQQQGQKEVSASEANVILCSEPVFTAALAYLLSGEVISQRETAGGGLIILAAILASSSSSASKE